MKAGWEVKPFEDCIKKVTYTSKIQRKDFLSEGAYPVISQEEDFINGYWNDEADLFKVEAPITIFGDHTKILKYVDFDFVLGADGVKILPPLDFLEPKFFYYQLQTANLESLGYARHYKLLKELNIVYPDRTQQQRIVAILDQTFEAIAKARANAEQNLKNARVLFESHLQLHLNNNNHDWSESYLGEVCDELFAGGDVPKENSSKLKSKKYAVPIYSNGEKNKGLYGFTNAARVTKPSITISARGTIGYSQIRNEPFYPAIRLIVITPKSDLLDLSFLKYLIENMDFIHSGVSIPQLTVPMIKEYLIKYPTLDIQKIIVKNLDNLSLESQHLEALYQRKIELLDELKKSLLQQAFAGEL